LALALVAAACGDDDAGTSTTAAPPSSTTTVAETTTTAPTTTSAAPTTAAGRANGILEVGTVLPETGDLAVLGPPMINAVQMAVEDINAAGGVLGQPLELTPGDSGTNEDIANAAADGHLAAGVDAIVGPASSRISLSVIDKITGAQTLMCSPSNTGSVFTTYDDNGGYYIRTAPPDNLQAQALGDRITADGYSEVAIIALNDAYGQGFADDLVTQLEANGATVVANVAYDPNGTVFDADVQQLADAAPEAVALIAFPDTGSLVLQAMIEQGVGPADLQIYLTDGLQSGDLASKVDPVDPAVLEGVKGTAPSAAPPGGAAWFPDAFAEYAPGTDTIFAAYAYDCPVIFALAAQTAGTDDPTVWINEVVGITKDGERCDSYASCLALIQAGTDIDYDGASGALNFADAGEPGAGFYDVWHLDNQGAVIVDETVPVG
ncbi:MAG TPA: ABC transporter substrate-binding protein, partial [Acidimicrobiia bacterium]|nr:ABC transporter substrate-binding protein [Acidimicrobiia bacterium]